MSTMKLLDRVAEHDMSAQTDRGTLEHKSIGLTSDPLVRFALVFAALIHDVGHPGVSNAQLAREEHAMALAYSNKSAAEQNSIDVAWSLLMEPRFADLRACLFSNEQDLHQFRQIVVNVVLSTDLFDQDLKAMREKRWNQTFHEPSSSTHDMTERKLSIIVELIIQASDVSHTMQHFTVYKKWNMCLLKEMYTAYQNGRASQNPIDTWYEGELSFFDNYIIPLAQKLRDCEVFGVACDEFLDYARDNRLEWELKGRAIVEDAKKTLPSVDMTRFEL